MESGKSNEISASMGSGSDGSVEQAAQRCFVDIAADEGPADAARENEGELAGLGLLVAAHVLDQPGSIPPAPIVAAYRAQPHRQSDRAEVPANARRIGRRA